MVKEKEVELDLLERALHSRKISLNFAPELEREYFNSRITLERRAMGILGVVGSLVFMAFWFFDRLVVPDIPSLSMIVRTGFCIPMMLLILAFERYTTALMRDWVLTLGVLSCNTALVILMHTSISPFRSALLLGIPLGLLHAITSPAITFRGMVMIVLCTIPVYIYAIDFMTEIPPELVLGGDMVIYSMMATLVALAYFNERRLRRVYLLTRRLELEKDQLRNDAQTDRLTQLFNRHWLDEHTPAMFAQARRTGQPLGLVMMDIDHFKAFNDRYGHPAGDVCISTVAESAHLAAGRDAYGVRFGGEEILFLFPGCDLPQIRERAESMRIAILEAGIPHQDSNWGVVTVSIGCATTASCPDQVKDCTALIEAADAALYRAKQSGRNTVRVQSFEILMTGTPEQDANRLLQAPN
jgi:diguanylate cyclase (GGDEF)-like protein